MSTLPKEIVITEVGLRDGLQIEERTLSTDDKEKLARSLRDSGLKKLEVGAFVRQDLVPQMADTAQLLVRIADLATTSTLCAIAPNTYGAKAAAESAASEVRLFLSASEGHSQSNTGRTVAEGVAAVLAAKEVVEQANKRAVVAIATAFVCPYDGVVPAARLAALVAQICADGVTHIILADTIGKAHPGQIRSSLAAVRDAVPDLSIGLHLHDTYGTGIANAWVGMEEGITEFDSAIGGIGGCPFAPGAAGNIATEDLVFVCNSAGVATGVDLEILNGIAETLPALLGHAIESRQSRIRASAAA